MNKALITRFQKMIDVNSPIIYIQDYDFVRIDELINVVVGKKKILEWNPATGCTDFKTKAQSGAGAKESLEDFLLTRYEEEPIKPQEKYVVLKDIQDYINDPRVKSLLHLIAQRRLYGIDYNTTVIIVSPNLQIPEDIDKYVSYLEIGFVDDEDEINQLIDEHTEVNQYHPLSAEDRKELMPSLKGMTLFEIDRMLDMAMSSNGSLSAEDQEMILQQKKQMVRKSGVLELIDTKDKLETRAKLDQTIGGMTALKDYLERKVKIFRNPVKAVEYHLPIPKGIFIVGMPGCGKSLCAKASAALFQKPLLKLDMGSLMGKYVGQSEANLRKAIQIAEAAAPCILWIDEIEKAFSGVGGNNDIMTRMFGYFLSWMQDKTSSVYVIATANNADKLPPELKRKGRFDEIFCVNLPSVEEREAIFKVHIGKKKQNVEISQQLLLATEGFNGADIEAVVNEALESRFVESANRDFKNGIRPVDSSLLTEIAQKTVSISMSCKKQIEDMKKLFSENSFKDASTGQIMIDNKHNA